ncbi:unnamed protein product [Phaedon cochleariae]|uniref:Putative inorganic phosphate cotransporter n=1 Tax=Phaedon cochleariae TaxID=80249 RepID=A0A9P0DMZ4_PHACE|nr:unnamed protein product [Phaedon cochleariae]
MSETVQQVEKPESYFGTRHLQYALLFGILNLAYGIRSILSVAIYAMITDDPPFESIPTYPEWTSKKNLILSSFFWGYIWLQIGAGQLAKNYGPKQFVGWAALIGSLFCCLLPLFGSLLGYGGVIACRILTGLTQGFIFPCVHNLIGAWTPLQDRAKIGSFTYAGGPLGTVISMPIAGFISNSSYGWPLVFYLYGGLGILWAITWFIVGSDSPSKHKSITPVERKYIECGIPSDDDRKNISTPWISILTSLPFWAILIAHCGQNLGFWTLLTEIPSYMQNVLKFKLSSNSTLSSLPYLAMWLLSLVMSPIADYLIVRKIRVGTSRKIFNSIGLFMPAISLVTMTFVEESPYLTVFILTVGVGFNSAVYSGYNINHIDLSPTHAGTLMGITNSISNIFSLVGPLIVDMVKSVTAYEETDRSLWSIVFYITSAVYVSTGIFYIVFGTGEVQPWNKPETQNEEETETKQAIGTEFELNSYKPTSNNC